MSVQLPRNIFAAIISGIVLINCGGGGGGSTTPVSNLSALVIPDITELDGNWASHSIDSGATPGWRQGNEQRNTAGAVTQNSITKNDGSTTTDPNYTLTIDSDDIITHSTEPTYRGAISQDRQLVTRFARNLTLVYLKPLPLFVLKLRSYSVEPIRWMI